MNGKKDIDPASEDLREDDLREDDEVSLPELETEEGPAGTLALTWCTCWPHPAQVVLPQVLHRVARHMGIALFCNSYVVSRGRR